MIKPTSKTILDAFKILKVTTAGGATVFLSTVSSCYFAVVIEKTAHRVQYHFFPDWYKDVEFALGLDLQKNNVIRSNGERDNTANDLKAIDDDEKEIEEMILSSHSSAIGLHHSELHPYWHDYFEGNRESFNSSAVEYEQNEMFDQQSEFNTASNSTETTKVSVMNILYPSIFQSSISPAKDDNKSKSLTNQNDESASTAVLACAMTA
mmetsp:Transcript_10540/g.11629  ORF Transcript_10540/g.11629 Transcript_10540/m.11629 type:complete len:208 (+) Transcript_10540:140-763(+)